MSNRTAPFFYKKIVGDFDCQVEGEFIETEGVTSSPGDGWGLTVMDSANENRFACVSIENYNGTLLTRVCDVFGGGTIVNTYGAAATTATYLRVVRDDDSWTFYASADGSSWVELAKVGYRLGVASADTTYVGLTYYCETSESGNLTINFDNFQFNDETCYSLESTNNPSWVVYDLLTDTHYGIGDYITSSTIDLDTFIDFATYCNESVSNAEGGYHRRHRFDGILDSSKPAWEHILNILENYRATMLKQGDDRLRVAWQRAQSPVQLFSDANIKEGSFQSTYQTPKVNANYWEVQFLNEEKDWEQDFVSYPDPDIEAGEPYRRRTTQIYGVTRAREALAAALFRCKSNRYQTQSVSFETGIDAVACEPYDVISVSTTQLGIGDSGRVINGFPGTIILDKPVTLEVGTSYQVQIRHSDDTMETQRVTNAAGTYDTLNVPSWTTTPAQDDIWAFGQTNIVTKPFTITKIERSGDLECKIDAVEYNADVYDDAITHIPRTKYSELPDPRQLPIDVSNLVLSERAQVMPDKTIQNVVDVTFSSGRNAQSYDIYYREKGGSTWVFAGSTKSQHYILQANFKVDSEYEVCVVSVGPFGAKKKPGTGANPGVPYEDIKIQGKTTRPTVKLADGITDITITVQRIGDSLVVMWEEIGDTSDLLGYAVRYADADTWEGADVLSDLTVGTKLLVGDFVTGAKYFMVKSINTSGLYSSDHASVLYTIPERAGESADLTRTEDTESWDGTKTNFTITGGDILQDVSTLTCSYETPELDLVSSSTRYVRCDISWDEQTTAYTWTTATFTWSSEIAQSLTWSGSPEGGDITQLVQIKYGDTTPISGSYETLVNGTQYTARHYRIKVTYTNSTAAYRAKVTDMVTTIAT
jgi:hypothetical protein